MRLNFHLSKLPGGGLKEKQLGFGLVVLLRLRAIGAGDSNDRYRNLVAHIKVRIVSNQDELRLLAN